MDPVWKESTEKLKRSRTQQWVWVGTGRGARMVSTEPKERGVLGGEGRSAETPPAEKAKFSKAFTT